METTLSKGQMYHTTLEYMVVRFAATSRQMGLRAHTVEELRAWQHELRCRLRRIIGLEQMISHAKDDGCRPVFVIGDGSAETVVIENFDAIYTALSVRHESKRRLVLACTWFDIVDKRPGSGDLFLLDAGIGRLDIAGGRCWSRGLNAEYSAKHAPDGIHIRNAGGDFWMFGFKNEGDGTKVETVAGGRSELYAYVLSNSATPSAEKPVLFISHESATTIHLGEGVLRNQPSGNLVRETRGGTTVEYRAAQAPRGNKGASALLLYGGAPARPDEKPPLTGYPPAAAP